MTVALLCIDLTNEYLNEKGKLSKGYVEFEKEHDILQRIKRIQEHVREQGGVVIHSRTCFTCENYHELGDTSNYFNKVKELGALKLDTWGTEFIETVAPKKNEPVINKHRFSAFSRTRLEIVLRANSVTDLYILGVSTLRNVAQCAAEAHDHDFKTVVLKDACVETDNVNQEMALKFIEGVAEVKDFTEIAMRIADHSCECPHCYG